MGLLLIILLVVAGVLGVLYWRDRALNAPPTEADIDDRPPVRPEAESPEVDEASIDPEVVWDEAPEPEPEPEIEPLVAARAPEPEPEPEIEPLVAARAPEPEPEPDLIEEPTSRFDRSFSRSNEPVVEEPVVEEPVYEEPVYEEPVYEEPEPMVAEREEPTVTTAGLAQRAPKETEAPTSRRSAMAQTSQRPTAPSTRSPEQVRAMLSNYKRGLQRGRVEAPENDADS